MARFECLSCGKTFARHAHLGRHQDIHLPSPRWSCPYCEHSYTRRDALNRHLSRCDAAAADARVPSGRVNRACQSCSERKVRCSRGQPCRRCAQSNIPCRYLVHGSSRRLPAPTTPSIPDMLSNPESGSGSATAHEEDAALFGTLEQQHASAGAGDPLYMLDPEGTNPWLSWGWSEPPWDLVESMPSMTTDLSEDQITDDPSYGVEAFNSPDVDTRGRVASIIDARIDPIECHRQTIIAHLQKSPVAVEQDEHWQWLVRADVTLLLKTYFTRHHRHTPIVHLPTFDIVKCPTSLIFALALIAASYNPSLGLRAKSVVVVAKCAYQLALESDEGLRSGGAASLETLQALVLLGIVDRFMVRRPPGAKYAIDLGEIVRLARTAGIFDDSSDPQNISWHDWAVVESRRRLGLVLFAFDAFISVLHDETPKVRADELNLRFPSPEFMFIAASAAEWKDAHQLRSDDSTTPCSVSLILSSLFCNLDQTAPLPNTLMGRFVLLNGILLHAWRTKQVLQENARALSDPTLEPYLESKQNAIHKSLRRWREGWPDNLLDFEPFSNRPSLYQDRAEACWHLAGIIMLPHVVIASPKTPKDDNSGVLSVQQTHERLMILSDQSRLHTLGQDFDATYRLVMGETLDNLCSDAPAALIYREADRARSGFEE